MTDLPIAVGVSASGNRLSCALRSADGSLSVLDDDRAPRRGRDVTQLVDRLFADAGYRPLDLRELRVDLGPGSYTGLRIAVTFARTALAFRQVTVSIATSFELIASSAWDERIAPVERTVRPVLDARRNRYHVAAVVRSPDTALAEPPRAVDRESMLRSIRHGDIVLAAAELHDVLGTATDAAGAELALLPQYSALQLFHEALRPRAAGLDDLDPLYLMGSYAD